MDGEDMNGVRNLDTVRNREEWYSCVFQVSAGNES